jgi:hypothetical protein
MNDWLGNELSIGDYVIFIGTDQFRWAKITDCKESIVCKNKIHEVGLQSVYIHYKKLYSSTKITWVRSKHCIKMDPPQEIRDAPALP